MKLRLPHFWTSLHWATRIAMLLVFFAIQWWQARYTWTRNTLMYGWPVSFNGLWMRYWRPWLLALDLAVWLALLASVGYTLERFWRKRNPFQFSLGSLFGLQAMLAVFLALGLAEGFLRALFEGNSYTTQYPRLDFESVSIGIDIGLFTDSPLKCPLARIAIIFAIGCIMYTAGSLMFRAVRHRAAAASSLPSYKVPAIARVVQWTLVVIDALLLLWSSFPPVFH